MDADIKINHHKRTSLSVDFGKRASVSNIIRLANWNLMELSKQESHKDPPSPNSSDPPTPRKRDTIDEAKERLKAPSEQTTREVMQVRRRASSEGWIQAYSLSSSPSPVRVLRRTNSDGLFQSFEGLVLTSGESYESRSQQSESGSASPRSFTDEIEELQFEPVFRPRPITKRESVLSLQNKLVTKSEDGRKSVLAASIENLIFKLTTREVPDFDLLHEFLLTYPYYLDSFKLLEYLKERFEYNPPHGADEALKKDYDEHRPVIRSRVYTVIKTWLKNYSFYFKKDKVLLRKVRQFIDIEIGSAKKIWADQLNALLVFLQLVNSNTNKKKKKKTSARRRNRSALTKGTTPRDNQPGSIEIVTTQSKPLVSKRSKDDLDVVSKPRSDTVFSLSSTNSDDSADTEPDLSSKFGDFIDMDGPKSNPAFTQPAPFLQSKLAAPKSSHALLAGRDRSESSASETSSVASSAATAGRISPPKVKPLSLKGIVKNGSPSPPNSPVKAVNGVKSSREEVKKPLSGGTKTSDSPRTDRDRSRSALKSPLTSPKAPEGEAFRRTHNRVRSSGNARIHTIVSPKDSPNQSLDIVDEEEKQRELEKARMKAKATKYKNELFNANVVKKPRNDFSPLLLSLDPYELAKQLTLIEHKKFSLIAPTELMMTNWKKKDRKTVSKRVCILIEWFNKMTSWVASEIVSAPILKQRVAVITFFIRVCEACKELNNFNTLMEILSGLDMTAVVRLKNTWESIPKKDMQSLEELREVVSRNDNYSRYRQEVDAINTPTPYLPYIGLILQDLVALEELPTIDRDGLVNFRKFKRVSKILQRVHDLKILNFKLEPIVPLQKYLKKGVQILGDMDLLRFSRVCEPSQQAMLF